ncbi:MAG: pyruvate:ferredoxin (flavodoxin) oxidoreductase, partial [Candidatus Nanoarchaeia archaeon]
NTGGQVSKASPLRANIPLSFGGKKQQKKPLAKILSLYENVYVATINPLAKPQQTLRALKEATQHDGPSVVFSYIPCKAQGIRTQDSRKQALLASNSGYWPLYQGHPQKGLKKTNNAPSSSIEELFSSEKRFLIHKNN